MKSVRKAVFYYRLNYLRVQCRINSDNNIQWLNSYTDAKLNKNLISGQSRWMCSLCANRFLSFAAFLSAQNCLQVESWLASSHMWMLQKQNLGSERCRWRQCLLERGCWWNRVRPGLTWLFLNGLIFSKCAETKWCIHRNTTFSLASEWEIDKGVIHVLLLTCTLSLCISHHVKTSNNQKSAYLKRGSEQLVHLNISCECGSVQGTVNDDWIISHSCHPIIRNLLKN